MSTCPNIFIVWVAPSYLRILLLSDQFVDIRVTRKTRALGTDECQSSWSVCSDQDNRISSESSPEEVSLGDNCIVIEVGGFGFCKNHRPGLSSLFLDKLPNQSAAMTGRSCQPEGA